MAKIGSVSKKERAQRNHYLYQEGHKKYRKKRHYNAICYFPIGKKLWTKYFRIEWPEPLSDPECQIR